MPRRLTIEELQARAHQHSGKLLSTSYINQRTKLRWCCNVGHEWEATSLSVWTLGHWCPICAGNARLTIEIMRAIALERGGECLSTKYINANTSLAWKCSEGHEWKAAPANIKNKAQWCPRCAGKTKLELTELQELAHTRGGECLSEEYSNNRDPLLWRCSEGHEWTACARDVKNLESWCLRCAGKARLTIGEMKTIALERDGECVSTEYVNSSSKLRWRCVKGHEWEATPSDVKNNESWCPYCKWKNEQECRDIVERLTGHKFPKKRPPWLQGLELDGYCKELGLAFEYQGEQHSRVVPWLHHDGERSLVKQKERDAKKADLCDDNWVTVIEIWHDCSNKEVFIARVLGELGYL